jgi:hypothetical protein
MSVLTHAADFYPNHLRKEWSQAAQLASIAARQASARAKMATTLAFYGAQQSHKAMLPGSSGPSGLSAVQRDGGARAREALDTAESSPGTENMRQALMFYSQGSPDAIARDQGAAARASLHR